MSSERSERGRFLPRIMWPLVCPNNASHRTMENISSILTMTIESCDFLLCIFATCNLIRWMHCDCARSLYSSRAAIPTPNSPRWGNRAHCLLTTCAFCSKQRSALNVIFSKVRREHDEKCPLFSVRPFLRVGGAIRSAWPPPGNYGNGLSSTCLVMAPGCGAVNIKIVEVVLDDAQWAKITLANRFSLDLIAPHE